MHHLTRTTIAIARWTQDGADRIFPHRLRTFMSRLPPLVRIPGAWAAATAQQVAASAIANDFICCYFVTVGRF